jgi:hypothetical protein
MNTTENTTPAPHLNAINPLEKSRATMLATTNDSIKWVNQLLSWLLLEGGYPLNTERNQIMTKTSLPKFPLGRVVITANAAQHIDTVAVNGALHRHEAGDWGDICPEDGWENELSLKEGFRLLSVYGKGELKFWIVTEADRSVTTILMPDDY